MIDGPRIRQSLGPINPQDTATLKASLQQGGYSLTADGSTNKPYKYEPQDVMRPELAYLMTNLMQGVINSGTAWRAAAKEAGIW